MSEAKEFNFIGQRTIRPDGHDKVTGKANYAADLALPGMIWGKILRSPHAHAKILKLDTSRAEAMTGVMSVATFDDLPSVSNEAIQSGEGATDALDLVMYWPETKCFITVMQLLLLQLKPRRSLKKRSH